MLAAASVDLCKLAILFFLTIVIRLLFIKQTILKQGFEALITRLALTSRKEFFSTAVEKVSGKGEGYFSTAHLPRMEALVEKLGK